MHREHAVVEFGHFKSGDFFDVGRYLTATVTIRNARPLAGAHPGQSIFGISASLRGVERTFSFPAVVAAFDGEYITVQAQMEFERTDFGSRYGSGRFFAYLGGDVVNDLVSLQRKIQAIRTEAWKRSNGRTQRRPPPPCQEPEPPPHDAEPPR